MNRSVIFLIKAMSDINEVIEKYTNMIHSIVQKNISLKNDLYEDYIQEGYEALIGAYHNYDSNKSKFCTYAYHAIKNRIIAYINKDIRQYKSREASVEDYNINKIDEGDIYNKGLSRVIVKKLFDKVTLTKKQYDCIRYRFGFDGDPKTFEQIGNIMGIKRPSAYQLYKNAMTRFKTFIKENEQT